jgi:glucose 1-dehydrogenase
VLGSGTIGLLAALILRLRGIEVTAFARTPKPYLNSDLLEAMEALGKNGVLVLASVTGGNQVVEVPAARINLEFVLGNKVIVGTVNGNREYFEAAVRDLAMAEAQFPGWIAQLLTHPVQGLDNYQQLIEALTSGKNVIKAFCEIAPLDAPVGSAVANGLVHAR